MPLCLNRRKTNNLYEYASMLLIKFPDVRDCSHCGASTRFHVDMFSFNSMQHSLCSEANLSYWRSFSLENICYIFFCYGLVLLLVELYIRDAVYRKGQTALSADNILSYPLRPHLKDVDSITFCFKINEFCLSV
jgi:hypothetical protein